MICGWGRKREEEKGRREERGGRGERAEGEAGMVGEGREDGGAVGGGATSLRPPSLTP